MTTRILLFISAILGTGCNSQDQSKTKRIDKLVDLAAVSDSLNDLTTSVKYYSEVLEIDSTNLVALNNRGRAYVWLGQIDKGFADFNKAVQLYPHEKTYYTRGMAYLYSKQFDKASIDFTKSIELNPEFGQALYGLSLVKAHQDSLDLALQFCGKAEKISYQPNLSIQVRSTIYEKKGDFKGVVIELTEAIKLNPTEAANYNNRGHAKDQLGQYEDAILDFDSAIKLDSKMAFAYNNKAHSLLKLGQLDDALEFVNISIDLNDTNAYAIKNRAEIFSALNLNKKACADLGRADRLSNDKELTAEIKQLAIKICRQ